MDPAPTDARRPAPPRGVSDARSNAQWLEALRGDRAESGGWVDLRRYLRGGLGRALARHALAPHDLDDILNDALLRIFENLDAFRGDSRFTTWAMAVAIRVAFATIRRRRREDLLGDTDPAQVASHALTMTPDALPLLERRSVLETLRAAIRERLTDRQRTAVLAELAGVPSDELARHLAIGRNALYKLHHDARRKLRQAILEAGFDADDVGAELARAAGES